MKDDRKQKLGKRNVLHYSHSVAYTATEFLEQFYLKLAQS